MRFDLIPTEYEKFKAWEKEIYAKGVAHQKATVVDPHDTYKFCWENGFPYCGAVGGQFTFYFTPTSIGTIIGVKDAITGEQIDLTDYEMF